MGAGGSKRAIVASWTICAFLLSERPMNTMRLNLSQAFLDYLRQKSPEKFTARQVAEWVFDTYPQQCQEKKQRSKFVTTDKQLLEQLVSEIGAHHGPLQGKHPQLKTTEDRPRQYYWLEQTQHEEVAVVERAIAPTPSEAAKLDEHALYPLLSRYLRQEFGLYCRRIDEKRSSNKRGAGGNHWLYPDMAGMEDLGEHWHREVRQCVNECSDRRARLWSFEVKLLINRSNVRECFFQAVSNSSWANFGWLVAADIEGQETLKELRMLFAAHGIGVIQLQANNPANSQVLIPARERSDIDWGMVNRLTEENRDFEDYVKRVRQFYQTGDARSIFGEPPSP